MEGTFDRCTTSVTLRLGGELEIGDAGELQARLLEALACGEPIRIVLEGVTALDVTGLQLLTAAEWAAQSRGVAWVRSGVLPESLRQTAEDLGWERVPFAGDAA